MHNFRQFFWAIWEDWVARMSGPASVILTFAAVIFGWDSAASAWWLWAAALVCLAFTFYRVWQKEYYERARLQAQMDDRTRHQANLEHLNSLITEGNGVRGRILATDDVATIQAGEQEVREWEARTVTFIGRAIPSFQGQFFNESILLDSYSGSEQRVNLLQRIDRRLYRLGELGQRLEVNRAIPSAG
jgi:hypothetical protein